MKFLLINTGNEGHANELVTSFWSEVIKNISVIDTISPFPELFPTLYLDSDVSEHFFLEYKDSKGNILSIPDRMKKVMEIIKYKSLKYDLIIFFTFDELFALNEELINSLYSTINETPITGIYYSSSYWRLEDKRGWCQAREKKLSKLNIPLVFSPDFIFESKNFEITPVFNLKWLPDFTTTNTDQSTLHIVNKITSTKKNRIVIGLIGSLGKWKGILELMHILNENNDLCNKILFVICGKIAKETFSSDELGFLTTTLEQLSNKIIYYPNFIDSTKGFNSIIENCDYMYCLYTNPQSSGILSKAIALKKKALCYNTHLIGDISYILPSETVSFSSLSSNTLYSLLSLDKKSQISKNALSPDKYRKFISSDSFSKLFLYEISKVIFPKKNYDSNLFVPLELLNIKKELINNLESKKI